MTKASVIIPTKNAGEGFEKLLTKIRSQNVSPIEIIIIDSGSSDKTVEIAEQFADEVIEIPPEEFHHARTRNRGANAATGDILIFTVQDAYPESDTWLSKLIAPIKSADADVTYGNQIAYPDAKPNNEFFYKYFYPDENITLTKEDTNDKGEFYLNNIFISDVCSALSREVWEDFQFGHSVNMSEDKDFAYRVTNGGYTIQYCPEAKIRHSHDYSLRTLFSRRYKDGMAFRNIATDGSDNFITDGFKYIISEYKYLIQSGFTYWIPYAFLYDIIYFVGFNLGKYHELLPNYLHRKLSN